MQRQFDVFEKFSDGSSIYRGTVSGKYNAQRKILEFSERSGNSFYAVDIGGLGPLMTSDQTWAKSVEPRNRKQGAA